MSIQLTRAHDGVLPADDQPERSAWTRPGFIVSAGVLGLVTVAALSFVVFPSDHHHAAAATTPKAITPRAAAKASPAHPRTAADSVCGLPAGDQTVPTIAPVAKWVLVGRTAAPGAPGIGPGKVNGDQRACYAHSPTGALYAAANTTALAEGRATFVWSVDNLFATGPGRDKILAATRAPSWELPPTMQMQGFHFIDYDPAAAVIDVAVRQSIPGTPDVFGHYILTLRWQGGDWKLVADATGNPYYQRDSIPDLSGYVPWSGV